MFQKVYVTEREIAHHGVLFGGPGSGKTTFLQLLIEATTGRMPVVVLDPKGSPALTQAVRSYGGVVWTLDGALGADLLDPRPWQVPDLLLEAEEYSPEARVFRDAAQQRALWAAWALALQGEQMDLQRLRELLDRNRLLAALRPSQERDPRIASWIAALARHDATADSGAHDLERALGTVLDGVAIRGSLATGANALHLENVLDRRGLVLFSLDVADYPHATRKVAAWVLLAMARLSRQLPTLNPGVARPQATRALLLVDEVGALGAQSRHLRGLVGRARETGLAVVLATQGPSDLEAVDRPLLNQVLQDTAWQLAFRQGSPADAQQMEALFGQIATQDVTRWSDGRRSIRNLEQPRVRMDEWMNGLEPGDAWLRVAPVDRGWRQHRVRVALPIFRKQRSETSSETKARATNDQFPILGEPGQPIDAGARALPPSPRPMLQATPPECPPELLERMGHDVLAKVERKWTSFRRDLGPCLVWRDYEPMIKAAGGLYGRLYDPELKRSDAAHLVVWRRCFPDKPIPKGWTVDHTCNVTLCQRPDHLQGPVTRAENTRRRHQRPPASKSAESTTTFAIALFDRITRPAVKARTVTLAELTDLLTLFDVLEDKREGRCWSPTRYAENASTRGNAGVLTISAFVFDLDRVPPEAKRLASLCWIGHTTWSHQPSAPRWRVVIPLAKPVPVADWSDLWRRARTVFCPEADPSCKDPGRAYWLPSCRPGAAVSSEYHVGRLLDAMSLPSVPADERRSAVPGEYSIKTVRVDGPISRRRARSYMARVVGALEAADIGGRNAALNSAAWSLGRWVAAGTLEQHEVEDGLYQAAVRNGLVADDGERQTWATIRSGLGAGMSNPVELVE